jgi:hypothetical protein
MPMPFQEKPAKADNRKALSWHKIKAMVSSDMINKHTGSISIHINMFNGGISSVKVEKIQSYKTLE